MKNIAKSIFWFGVGAGLGLFFITSFIFLVFQKIYENRVFPGVYVSNVNFGGQSQQQAKAYFIQQNKNIEKSVISFRYDNQIATTSAKKLKIGYNADLLAQQAYMTGRSIYILSNIVLVFKAYLNSILLPASFTYSEDQLTHILSPINKAVSVVPVDALFAFIPAGSTSQYGKVTAFRPSSNGQKINLDKAKQQLESLVPSILQAQTTQNITIPISLQILKPHVSTADANKMGISELIGEGTSLFQHSIPGRIYNITLASTRLNGILVAPGEEFSFDKALGDVSSFTGYQQAYIISNGKTILGDGGGVCQVSTTLFRAILNAGLPITERHGHAYRVGYYEENSPPGLDATVYVPTVDLKFKNDTANSILIQTAIDPNELKLTFYLYGTKDGRTVTITTPIVTHQSPAPPPLYTDDPTLPKGVIKQIDFAAPGAHVEFNRTVMKDGKILYNDTFSTDYQPWQASYLRGTKE